MFKVLLLSKQGIQTKSPKEFLKLIDVNIKSAEKEFNKLDLGEKKELINKTKYHNKKKILFLSNDCTELLQSLAQPDLLDIYFSLCDHEISSIYHSLSGAQFKFLICLELWEKDKLNPNHILHWVEKFLLCKHEHIKSNLECLDPEFLASLLVMTGTKINCKDFRSFSPEDFETDQPLIEEFITFIYLSSQEQFNEICKAMAFVSQRDLENEVGRIHHGEIAEYHIPSFQEAKRIYNINSDDGLEDIYTTYDSSISLTVKENNFFFTRLFQYTGPESLNLNEKDLLQKSFHKISMQVVIADNLGIDADTIEAAKRKTFFLCSLGLEILCKNDLSLASKYLQNSGLIFCFQLGYKKISLFQENIRFIKNLNWDEKYDLNSKVTEALLLKLHSFKIPPIYFLNDNEIIEIKSLTSLNDLEAYIKKEFQF